MEKNEELDFLKNGKLNKYLVADYIIDENAFKKDVAKYAKDAIVNKSMSHLKESILKWFASGRVGISSKAMACAVIDIPQNDKWSDNYPRDPDDFNRCLLLLALVPEIRNHFDKIASISDTWRRFIDKWCDLEECFLDEAGLNWEKATRAPKTYKLMESIIYGNKIKQ